MAAEYRVSAQEITPEERNVQGVRGRTARFAAHCTVITRICGVIAPRATRCRAAWIVLARYLLGLAPLIGVPRRFMPESRKSNPPRPRKYVRQRFDGCLKVRRTLPSAEQKKVGADVLEPLERAFRFANELEIVMERRREHPHGHVTGPRVAVLSRDHVLRERHH